MRRLARGAQRRSAARPGPQAASPQAGGAGATGRLSPHGGRGGALGETSWAARGRDFPAPHGRGLRPVVGVRRGPGGRRLGPALGPAGRGPRRGGGSPTAQRPQSGRRRGRGRRPRRRQRPGVAGSGPRPRRPRAHARDAGPDRPPPRRPRRPSAADRGGVRLLRLPRRASGLRPRRAALHRAGRGRVDGPPVLLAGGHGRSPVGRCGAHRRGRGRPDGYSPLSGAANPPEAPSLRPGGRGSVRRCACTARPPRRTRR